MVLVALACISLGGDAQAQKVKKENAAPDIRYCEKPADVLGIWQLSDLYEEPAGELTSAKIARPYQYMRFKKNGVYELSYRTTPFADNTQATAGLAADKNVWQYIIGEQGLIYFYKNQIFSHSTYCGKVTKGTKNYPLGGIILTPSDAAGKQVYQTFQAFDTPPKATTKKKRKKRRKKPVKK